MQKTEILAQAVVGDENGLVTVALQASPGQPGWIDVVGYKNGQNKGTFMTLRFVPGGQRLSGQLNDVGGSPDTFAVDEDGHITNG